MSTGTLGTGANIQKNLYALHHIDVPWKPSDFEQREGRILRQFDKFANFTKLIFGFKVSAEVCEFFVTTFPNVAARLSKRSTLHLSNKSGRKYLVITYSSVIEFETGVP